MLSVLIPIYNVTVQPLVHALHQQQSELETKIEIICIDDGSTADVKEVNRDLNTYCDYSELPQNVGRAKIRNLLAAKASYEYLLYLDCDAEIISDNFLKNYLRNLPTSGVMVGGRVYGDRPDDISLQLHWKFGRKREAAKASEFQSNNFLIPKSILLDHPFDEQIITYGHEDTLLGYQILRDGVEIHYIYNPVMHADLIPAPEFLEKQDQAVENLIQLQRRYPDIQTRLTRTVQKLERLGVDSMVQFILKLMIPTIRARLSRGKTTSLGLLDLYKIGKFLSVSAYAE